jgi:putative endonuclease
MNKTTLGRRGEERAASILKANGYRILGRNVRSRFGEIDVVAREGGVLCIVEVKTRTGLSFGFPEESVTLQKQARLKRLALWYLQSRRLLESPVRFDVVSILLSEGGDVARSRLIKRAFE